MLLHKLFNVTLMVLYHYLIIFTDYIAERGIDPLVYAKTFLGQEALKRLLQNQSAKSCIER